MKSGGNILVVDDDREALKLEVEILMAGDYRVRPADSGELALTMVFARKPDLILLDIRMPGMDGFDVCRRLKAREESHDIPIVFLSAINDTEARVEGLRMGAVDFVDKPFRAEELLARVKIHLELSQLRHELEREVAERTDQLHKEFVALTQTQEALRRERDLVSRILETNPIGLVAFDRDGKIIFANEGAAGMFGQSRSETTGKTYSSATWRITNYAGGPIAEEELPFRRVKASGKAVYGVQHAIKHPDGQQVLISINAAPLFSESSEFEGMVAAIENVTERQRNEVERERLFVEAQTANRAKDQFVAMLSHELRTPLAAIYSGVELLRRTGRVGDSVVAANALDIIDRNARLQARLVDDLLSFSQLMQGKVTLQRAPMLFESVIYPAVEALRAEAARTGISLETRLASGLWINGDIDRLQEVVMNLLSNAVKFTLRGGKVVLSLQPADGWARLVIEDTGIGIEEKRLSTIFEAFQQGQVGGQRASGLGIGLTLVKSLIEMHQGRVLAQSDGPGKGSRFTVELPLTVPLQAMRAKPSQGPLRENVKVLVVEDNPDTREMLVQTLEMLSYQVIPAENGEVAMSLLSRESVNVILVDIGLPGMDGYELLHRTRQLPEMTLAPAFAVTGYGQARDVARAKEAGFLGHFVKPVDIASLDKRIREAVGVAEAAGTSDSP